MKNQVKDTRLWNKGSDGIIPFTTRSQKLAIDLMKTVGMKDCIIKSFKEGKVLKTNSLNPLSISQIGLTELDERIISDLEKNGLLVYHVLLSNYMVGKQTEIQSEHEVSTYEKVITAKSYLCVPMDIFAEAITFHEGVTNESNKGLVIKEHTEHEIFMATQGYMHAYIVNEDGSADFYNVGVNVYNGDLLRVT